jgi:hypothetical protein
MRPAASVTRCLESFSMTLTSEQRQYSGYKALNLVLNEALQREWQMLLYCVLDLRKKSVAESLKGRDQLGDLGVDGRIILNGC